MFTFGLICFMLNLLIVIFDKRSWMRAMGLFGLVASCIIMMLG
jgi:hypothetical protein